MSVIEAPSAQTKSRLAVLDLAEYSSAEEFMAKVFHKEKHSSLNQMNEVPTSFKVDDCDKTSGLIEAASKTIEILSARCDNLENELEYEKTNCSDQEAQIEVLKKILVEFKAKQSVFESDVKSWTLRCHTAEARVADLERVQKDTTLRASKAESISSKLQQQVEAAFGQGSPIRTVMESVKSLEAMA